jgi:hypothetical protein
MVSTDTFASAGAVIVYREKVGPRDCATVVEVMKAYGSRRGAEHSPRLTNSRKHSFAELVKPRELPDA